jgi:hypothetical protein
LGLVRHIRKRHEPCLLEFGLADVLHFSVCINGNQPAPDTSANNQRITTDERLRRVIEQVTSPKQGSDVDSLCDCLIVQSFPGHLNRRKMPTLFKAFQFAQHRGKMPFDGALYSPFLFATDLRCHEHSHDQHCSDGTYDLPLIHGAVELLLYGSRDAYWNQFFKQIRKS